MPDINFPSSPSGGDTYTFNNITFTYDGEKWTAKAPVTSTSTYGDANVAAYASSQGFIDLTDISVTSNSPSSNGSLSYNNGSGVFTFTPADASGSGSGTDQTLSVSGNVITISGNNDTVDLTSTLSAYATKSTPVFVGNAFFSDSSANYNPISFTFNGGEYGYTSNIIIGPLYSYDISDIEEELTLDGINQLRIENGEYATKVYTDEGSETNTNPFYIYAKDNDLHIGNASTSMLHLDTGESSIRIQKNSSTSTYWSLPTERGTNGQVLTLNGTGGASWQTPSDSDAQDLTLSGNVISLTGQSGNVDLTSLLATQPTTVTADSTDGTALALEGGDATGLNSTGGNVDINSGTGALQNGYVNIGDSSQGVNIGANSSTAISITGPLTVNNQLIIEDGVSEKFSSLTGATGVVTHDCDNGHIFYHSSISADFTANFTNLGLSTNYGTTLTLILDQGATARIPSAVQISGSAQTINWQGGSAPTGTNNGIDAVSFTILRVSGSYVVLGQLVDFT